VRVYGLAEGPQLGAVKVFVQSGNELLIGGDRGVAIQRGERFRRLILNDESPLSGVTGLVVAADGDLWLNGSMGIVRVPKVELSAFLANTEYKPNFELFDYHDGVQGLASPIAGLGSALQGPDGKLYFTTRNNLYWIDPGAIRRNKIAPSVTIDEVRSDARSIAWPSEPFELQPNPQTVQIRYEGGSLWIPDRVRFRYRLDNYDKDWVDAGARREAFYSKLPPGSYTFHVIAVNDAGVWNNTGATVSFSVAPTLVQKAWFRIGVLLTLIALAILVFRVRLNLSRRRLSNEMFRILEERQRIARDLHDTLLQSMQSLMFKFAVATEKLDTDDPIRPIFEATLEQSDQVLL
jgi:hypothetical protein